MNGHQNVLVTFPGTLADSGIDLQQSGLSWRCFWWPPRSRLELPLETEAVSDWLMLVGRWLSSALTDPSTTESPKWVRHSKAQCSASLVAVAEREPQPKCSKPSLTTLHLNHCPPLMAFIASPSPALRFANVGSKASPSSLASSLETHRALGCAVSAEVSFAESELRGLAIPHAPATNGMVTMAGNVVYVHLV